MRWATLLTAFVLLVFGAAWLLRPERATGSVMPTPSPSLTRRPTVQAPAPGAARRSVSPLPARPEASTPAQQLPSVKLAMPLEMPDRPAPLRVSIVRPEKTDPHLAWYQTQLDHFCAEAALTDEQRQKLMRILYDVKVLDSAVFWSNLDQKLYEGTNSRLADGGDLLREGSDLIAGEGLRRIRELLTEGQYEAFQSHIGGMVGILSSALTFVDENGVELPIPRASRVTIDGP
jgi:hypothetical protein